jgi:hypothetical protein
MINIMLMMLMIIYLEYLLLNNNLYIIIQLSLYQIIKQQTENCLKSFSCGSTLYSCNCLFCSSQKTIKNLPRHTLLHLGGVTLHHQLSISKYRTTEFQPDETYFDIAKEIYICHEGKTDRI